MANNSEPRVYEGMFLIEPGVASMWDDLTKNLHGLLERHGADVVGITRWDERKLAYPVKKERRGTYVLSFFTLTDPSTLAAIEHDARLDENILRLLVVRADQFTVADMRHQLGEDVDDAVAARLTEVRGENLPEDEEAEQVGAAAEADAGEGAETAEPEKS
jgi:small subunit ribosomal protein S6